MKSEEFLKYVELFTDLSPRYFKQVSKLTKIKKYNKGDFIVRQGDQGIGMFIITSGKVQVQKKNESGQTINIATHGPGEFFGEMSVLDGAPRTASVVALEDTECLVLLSWDFNSLMQAHPKIALEILPVVVRRFRETNVKLLER